MEAIKQIMRVPKNHEIKIKVPEYLSENETIEVILIVKKKSDNFGKKINEMKDAMKDKLFLNDLREITDDFETFDLETWDSDNGV
jgi:hypothetical protein